MSLQVWLPLTGHLNNQGLSNVTVTNNGATVDNNGKIGKCYSFDGTDDKITLTNLPNPSNISVAFWMKRSANTGTRQFMFTAWNGVTCELTTSGEIRCYVAPSHGACVSTEAITVDDGWVHVVYTFEDKICGKLYINGSLIRTTTSSNSISWNTTTGNLGYFSTYFNGKLNDFRIYDHVLSAKEVKELAKGLVLHYPLTGGGRSGDNLLKNSNVNISNTSYPTTTLQLNPAPAAGDTVTISIKGQLGTGKSYWGIYNSGGSIGLVSIYESDKKNGVYKKTFNWTINTASNTSVHIYPIPSSVSATSSIEWVKLEYGNNATPWMPNSADAAYAAMGYNSTTEYDVSGYNYHGTKNGTITYKSDSARYSIASHFINGSYIMANKNSPDYLPKDAITVNLWIRCTTWGNPISCTESGGFNFENSSGNVGFIVYLSGVGYKTAYGIPVGNLTDGKWHMLTGVYDRINQVVNTYLDTQLMKTTATGSSAVIGYANNRLIISGEAQSTTPASSTFVGEESDVRIYARALTADDVKELYNTAASLANNGTLFAYEYVEA